MGLICFFKKNGREKKVETLNKNVWQQRIKKMLKPVSIRKSVLTRSADCPADNHARQLALFLYETLALIWYGKGTSFTELKGHSLHF